MDGPWAHSVNQLGTRHQLTDHLRGTAALAATFAEPFGAGRIAWWLGLLHDTGKAACGWQQRLLEVEGSDQRVGHDHKRLGVLMAAERGLGKFAMAVQGHHGGLTDPESLRGWLKAATPDQTAAQADARAAITRLLPELMGAERPRAPQAWENDPHVAEMGLRLVFSALCDADFLDTAAHFAAQSRPSVRDNTDFSVLRDRFERRRRAMLADAGRRKAKIDGIRDDVYQACVAVAARAPGMFRLAAPTGSGKTISCAAFAVHHAALHGKRRIVVAVPFLTITEQNADVYRGLLDEDGDRVVLEHHSGVDHDEAGRGWERLAAENWDAPFVVTTMVRLFESLFDRRPAAMRRLHRLAGSVIVLDEVQALPHELLVPILDALRTLVTHFGVTVVLSSATQPAFWSLRPFRDIQAHDIIAEPQSLVNKLRRVEFEWWVDPRPTLAEVATRAGLLHQVLVVVNTTADAKAVFENWRTAAKPAWHLSTRMCPAHRRRVLAEVRASLERGEAVKLVSTQLIEAGVDIDFPVVYRLMAPADSLLQAAGRANRDGNLRGPGRVVIVAASDAGQPPSYRTLVDTTSLYFGPAKAEPDDLKALDDYYQAVYGSLALEHHDSRGMLLQGARAALDFRTTRDRFRMIDEAGVAVVTSQGAADDEEKALADLAIHRLRTAPQPCAADVRALQPYMTSLHTSALRVPGVLALLRPIIGSPQPAGGPLSWNGVLAEWLGEYDPVTGIDLDPHVESFLV
ncbi:CRISPR-associated helicase Cas3' [Nonomuraea longicatena]|uniref:CRISPR-associated helicase/endonuclease Cas3 n=1 Tax=Nonomuraea longicatena TaxID=83682 RepID=A0ABP3ZCM9_9ACTN